MTTMITRNAKTTKLTATILAAAMTLGASPAFASPAADRAAAGEARLAETGEAENLARLADVHELHAAMATRKAKAEREAAAETRKARKAKVEKLATRKALANRAAKAEAKEAREARVAAMKARKAYEAAENRKADDLRKARAERSRTLAIKARVTKPAVERPNPRVAAARTASPRPIARDLRAVVSNENVKHASRVAMIERIMELAADARDRELLSFASDLMKKESLRHDRFLTKLSV